MGGLERKEIAIFRSRLNIKKIEAGFVSAAFFYLLKAMKKEKNFKEGIIAIDKPLGMTSHDVVARIRRFS